MGIGRSDESHRTLPKNAAVCRQWVRCGRRPCRCGSGQGHGPYWYLFWREGGRLRKTYVPSVGADALAGMVAARRRQRRMARAQVAAAKDSIRDSVLRLREMEGTWN